METKITFSSTVYGFGGDCDKSNGFYDTGDIAINSSPNIRKSLPQTSMLISKEKAKKLSQERTKTPLDNEIEFITFSQNEKIIATKSLRLLINEIISRYPNCRFRRDLYETSSEVYRYCYDEELNKIKNISEIKSNPKLVILSRRHKIHKRELKLKNNSIGEQKNQQSYQVINFNQTILNKFLVEPGKSQFFGACVKKKSRIPKILKDTREKLSSKKYLIPFISYQSCKTSTRAKKKSPVFLSSFKYSQKSTQNSLSSLPRQERITIPARLYKEITSQDFKSSSTLSKFL